MSTVNNIPIARKIASALHACRRDKDNYNVMVLGKLFIVYPGVFSPKYCADTAFYAEQIPVSPGDTILEIGCGTGIVSIFALFKGAHSAVATDINPMAVKNTMENAIRHNVMPRMSIRQGDVYAALISDEQFDLIFWNLPFGYVEKEKVSIEEMAVFDPGYRALKRFISGAADHLKKDGRLLFGCCPELARMDLITDLLSQSGYGYRILSQTETMHLSENITLQLYEAESH